MILTTLDSHNEGYTPGYFDLGDTIYHVESKHHIYRKNKQCQYCDNSGTITIKGKCFTCPECKGYYDKVHIAEYKATDILLKEKHKITDIYRYKNKNTEIEVYQSDGIVINNKHNNYYNNMADAEKEAAERNKKYEIQKNELIREGWIETIT